MGIRNGGYHFVHVVECLVETCSLGKCHSHVQHLSAHVHRVQLWLARLVQKYFATSFECIVTVGEESELERNKYNIVMQFNQAFFSVDKGVEVNC